MGTPSFAVPSLQALLAHHDVRLVVSRPDEPQGRGQKLQSPPVALLAKEAGVPLAQPQKVRTPEFLQLLAEHQPEVIVVVAYGKILPKSVLDLPPHGCVNVHASLLPKYRGAAPIQWAIARGESVTGVTLMQMDEGMDTGPMITTASLPITEEDTSETLAPRLAALGADTLTAALPRYLAGELRPTPQPSEGATMAPILKKEDGRLQWTLPARALACVVRGMNPWPVAHCLLPNGQVLRVLQARPCEGTGAPGTVLSVNPKAKDLALTVACGDGALALLAVQQEGRKVQPGHIFATGNLLKPGLLLF